jgi:EAL domain-containing protein (putative c-di-GMP-specific phosphodiesterase class I)
MTGTTLLQEVLAEGGLTTLFQPIFNIVDGSRELFAVEALSRGPKGSNGERADVLFEYVRRKGKEIEVDRACTLAALKAAAASALSCAISINVHATTFERDAHWVGFLGEACAEHGVPMSRLILEIVEQQKFWDERRFFRTIEQLRESNVRIALDDIGLGYSNYRMLIEIRPDFCKIDRFFVTGCGTNRDTRAATESIRFLAERLGGEVIAEGVETEDDLRTLCSLGIHYMQGYYLAPPLPSPEETKDSRSPALTLCAR